MFCSEHGENNNKPFLHKEQCIQFVIKYLYAPQDLNLCLSDVWHIINLTTQAPIKAYLKSKYYNPTKPNKHTPDTEALICDEVGLVHAISVKVSTCICNFYF